MLISLRSFSLLLLCSVARVATGQDWALFPLEQRSYYADSIGIDRASVHMSLFDSTRTTIEGLVSYTRRKLPIEGAGDCTPEVLAFMYMPASDPYAIDSLVERNDTVFYSYLSITSPFYFLPRASLGQSWTVVSSYSGNTYPDITITCSAIEEATFLGVTDSVKTFSLVGGGSAPSINAHVIRLSKNHGLIQFVPFQQFLYHPSYQPFQSLDMVGIEQGGVAQGLLAPTFEDFFHPIAGDILLWEQEFVSGWILNPSWVKFHRDSIVQVTTTVDSIVVEYDRTTLDVDSSIDQSFGLVNVIRRSVLQDLVQSSPHWFVAADVEVNGWNYAQWGTSSVVWREEAHEVRTPPTWADTVFTISLGSGLQLVDTTVCEVGEIADIFYEVAFDTRAGVIRLCDDWNMSTHCVTLIASRIDGDLQGAINLSVPPLRNEGSGALRLYPVPAEDRLFLSGVDQNPKPRYRVIDRTGSVVLEGVFDGSSITVGSLPSGLYGLMLISDDAVRVETFVKR